MSERRRDDTRDAAGLVGDLAGTVEELQGELAGETGQRRTPTPRDLARFTSEVTIPAIVLVLETNVRALKLFQRALRLATGQTVSTEQSSAKARERAEALGRETLTRLDDALADLQESLAGRPPDDPARELLAEARTLRQEIDERLAAGGRPGEDETVQGTDRPGQRGVDIDVESELQSIKDDIKDDSGGDNGRDNGDDGTAGDEY